ncbi:hypothetical protein [Enterococcus sp. LJL51]
MRLVEEQVKVIFPKDYVEVVLDNNGGYPDLHIFT